MAARVSVQFECGHRSAIARWEYGDGSAWCLACADFMVYERCLTCHSLDCQAKDGPTLAHEATDGRETVAVNPNGPNTPDLQGREGWAHLGSK